MNGLTMIEKHNKFRPNLCSESILGGNFIVLRFKTIWKNYVTFILEKGLKFIFPYN